MRSPLAWDIKERASPPPSGTRPYPPVACPPRDPQSHPTSPRRFSAAHCDAEGQESAISPPMPPEQPPGEGGGRGKTPGGPARRGGPRNALAPGRGGPRAPGGGTPPAARGERRWGGEMPSP